MLHSSFLSAVFQLVQDNDGNYPISIGEGAFRGRQIGWNNRDDFLIGKMPSLLYASSRIAWSFFLYYHFVSSCHLSHVRLLTSEKKK